MAKRYWLFKSEPETFSIQHLMRMPGQVSPWDGVRNYQARNLLRDDVTRGDGVLFYHSSTKETGVAGVCEIVSEGYPDPTAFDSRSPFFDQRSTPDRPQWYCVDVKFVRALPRVILLSELKRHLPTASMMVCRRGMRLSVQPVTAEEWQAVLEMAEK